LDPPQSQEEDVTFTQVSEVVDVPDIEPRVDVSCKAEKPKRSVGLLSMFTMSLCGPKQNTELWFVACYCFALNLNGQY
jgi:hypothetical protein